MDGIPSGASEAYGVRNTAGSAGTVQTVEDGVNVYWDKDRYNTRWERPTNRHPLKNRWTTQGYERSRPYSQVSTQTPQIQETSFTGPVRGAEAPDLSTLGEGIRQRRPIQRQEQSDRSRNPIRQPTSERGSSQPYERFDQSGPTRETRINIPDISNAERVPLLGASSAASVGGIGGSASTVVGGIGAIAAAGALGYGTSKVVESIKEHGAVLPGTEYVGPGNPIREGPARHPTDQIARDHDIGYRDTLAEAKAKHWTEQKLAREIGKLDDTARNAFWNEYSTQGSWQSLVGSLGLKIKQGVEGQVGLIYPSLSGKNKCHIINLLQMKGPTGVDSMRDRDDTHGSNTIWHSCEEVYPLIIPFQVGTNNQQTQTTSTTYSLDPQLVKKHLQQILEEKYPEIKGKKTWSDKLLKISTKVCLKALLKALLINLFIQWLTRQ